MKKYLFILFIFLFASSVMALDCRYTYMDDYDETITGFFYKNGTHASGDLVFTFLEGNLTLKDSNNETRVIASSDNHSRLINVENTLNLDLRLEFLYS